MGVVVVHVVVLLQFEFHLTDQTLLRKLEINLFTKCNSGTGKQSNFLRKVDIPMNIVQNKPTNIVRWYPLLKRGLFSNIKGDLG
jgi:hypothetical protein